MRRRVFFSLFRFVCLLCSLFVHLRSIGFTSFKYSKSQQHHYVNMPTIQSNSEKNTSRKQILLMCLDSSFRFCQLLSLYLAICHVWKFMGCQLEKPNAVKTEWKAKKNDNNKCDSVAVRIQIEWVQSERAEYYIIFHVFTTEQIFPSRFS